MTTKNAKMNVKSLMWKDDKMLNVYWSSEILINWNTVSSIPGNLKVTASGCTKKHIKIY